MCLYDIPKVAGGTGITPMYQLVKQILRDPEDKTSISIVFGSRTEKDILLKSELAILAQTHPDRLKVKHVVQQADPEKWPGERGIISEQSLKDSLPNSNSNCLILVCGPEG
jgi:cytochrome-b5 reductase